MNMSAIEELKVLSLENKYVFHGSGCIIDEFEPRQAFTIINNQKISDGVPAIFASPVINYAIFMALINRENCPKGYRSGVSFHNNIPKYRATEETLTQINENTQGYVYVFNKTDFKERNDSEWVSYENKKPIMNFKVSMTDFLPIIEIINE